MCGILAIFGSTLDEKVIKKLALKLSRKIRHRGPDWSGFDIRSYQNEKGKHLVDVVAHERLAIVDIDQGAQPLFDENKSTVLSVNGEIYNHLELRKKFSSVSYKTKSDCEPILHLYKIFGKDCIHLFDGVFAFVISQTDKKNYFAARDPIGVNPLYYGFGIDGSIWFSSEMKSLAENCEVFKEFPPGHFWTPEDGFVQWFVPVWFKELNPYQPLDLVKIRITLEESVAKRLMSDVPYGVLLSGGLDSSLIASIACRQVLKKPEDNIWSNKIQSFAVGLANSPDLKAAREVSKFLKTFHHEFHFTIEEGLNALADVIYHIESYDITTVRASVPMFLMSRKIKANGIKMVFSGEGSDEIFGGYLYFHKAPNPKAFQTEIVKKIQMLSRYDCLRANKATSAWGVEVRVPFLDKNFLNVAMSINPKEKMIQDRPEGRIEKWVLRKAFDDPINPYLPKSILWRQKEQFSDGVGYDWIDSLRSYAESHVSDLEMSNASKLYPHNTPFTKEAFLYRQIFESYFPQTSAIQLIPGGPSIACSTPAAVEWEKNWKNQADPSGRSINNVHINGIKTN